VFIVNIIIETYHPFKVRNKCKNDWSIIYIYVHVHGSRNYWILNTFVSVFVYRCGSIFANSVGWRIPFGASRNTTSTTLRKTHQQGNVTG